ncbi:5444_t:CDS:2 [Dentiscutata erythropus]|uniref:5444_t:CDS:1 n=1 Tax=Dentiscutata erythropus TaxID=1348616 RepID=A0A9N9CJE4_9GLOM|nr:5444_t:CDS:2 [Dentiscutata erythropus]
MKKNSKELASHYKKLLQDGHNSDVIIRFIQGEDLKEFYAHSLILRARSSFFDSALSSRWARKQENFFIIEMKDVSINTFKAVLKYIYTTEISLNELSGIEILEFLVETDRLLLLNEGINRKLFSYIYENLEEIMRNDAIETLQIIFLYNNIFKTLYGPCLQLICTYPNMVFEHPRFTHLDSSILTLILKRDDLGKLSEFSILSYLIQWVIAQLPTTTQEKNIDTWENDDYIELKSAINEFIPLIRWYQISSREFRPNRQLLQNILPEALYNSILTYYLNPSSLPVETVNLNLRPRYASEYVSSEPKYEAFFSSYEDLVNINKSLIQINEQCDIIIRVSKDTDFKEFYAHSLILCARSSYFKAALSNIKKDESPFIYPIQDISTIVFEVILRYLYTTEFDVEKLNGANILMLIVAANKMGLEVIHDYLLLPSNFRAMTLRKLNEAILAKLNCAQVLEIIEKTEELIIQKSIANILSNKTFINNILYKFNANDILKLMRMPNNMKSRKTIDNLLMSDNFINIILDKLDIAQFLQFMKTASKLQNEIIVNNLFSKVNLNLIVNKFHGTEILYTLIEANILQLQNLFTEMSIFIEQNLENLLQNDAVGVLEMVFEYDICKSFREYSIYLICLNPNALFGNHNLIQLNRSILNRILERDDMGKLSEKNICDYLIRWGAAQNEETSRKSKMTWTSQEFKIFEEVIHDFIPLIRWFTLPAKDFDKIRSFLKNVIPDDLYQNIVDYYLDPNLLSEEMKSYSQKRILPCTFLLKPRHFKIFESWIEELNQKNKSFVHKLFNSNATNEKKNHFKEITLNTRPTHFSNNNLYDFILLYRGSENDFKAKEFHDSCDNKGSTLTIIKTSDQRIFGGYNDSNTENHYIERIVSRNNFLFSFDSQNDFGTSKLASVNKNSWVSEYQSDYGPCFGCNKNNFDMYIDSKHLHISNSNVYPNLKNFISLNSTLLIEDYEVWQVSKKKTRYKARR